MKIRNKINFIFMAEFVFMVVLLGFVMGKLSVDEIEKEIIFHMETAVDSRADHVQTYFTQTKERLKLITSRTKLRKTLLEHREQPSNDKLETMRSILEDALDPIKDFERICLLDGQGVVLVSTGEGFVGKEIANKDFFEKAKKDYKISFEDEGEEEKIYVAGPLMLDGEFLGVALSVISLNELRQIADDRTGMGETGEVILATQNKGKIELLNKEEEGSRLNYLLEKDQNHPIESAFLEKEKIYKDYIDYRNMEVLAVSRYLEEYDVALVAKINKKEALRGGRRLVYWFFGLSIVLVLIYWFLTKTLSKIITRPIERLQKGAEIIKDGDLDHRVGTEENDEIGELSRVFDDMTDTIKESYSEIDEKVAEQTVKIKAQQEQAEKQQKAILNVLEDVEVEKERTQSLARDLEKFKMAVDNASDHIVITDTEGVAVYVNWAVERITGFSPEEVVGQKAGTKENWGGQMDKKFYKQMWKTIKEDKKVFSGEFENKRKNGEKYTVSASIAPVFEESGEVVFFVGIERDITKEKQIDRAKTEFVSLASHQLRTPLSAINWYTEMLLDGDAGEIADQQKEYLQEVYRGNQRMVKLVNALLNVSRLELGTFAIEPEKANLVKIAESVLKELTPKIKEKKQKVEKKISKNIPDLKLDVNLTRMIFQNLLSNAVKYTPEKGKISLTIKKQKNDYLIEVADNGMGIPQNQQGQIFKKLFRADNVREKDTEGTGLGLYIIKSIVNNIGGKIWFESKKNKGTTFSLTIPAGGMKKKSGAKKLN